MKMVEMERNSIMFADRKSRVEQLMTYTKIRSSI